MTPRPTGSQTTQKFENPKREQSSKTTIELIKGWKGNPVEKGFAKNGPEEKADGQVTEKGQELEVPGLSPSGQGMVSD